MKLLLVLASLGWGGIVRTPKTMFMDDCLKYMNDVECRDFWELKQSQEEPSVPQKDNAAGTFQAACGQTHYTKTGRTDKPFFKCVILNTKTGEYKTVEP